jgi:membrane protease YdiL (CAAX protease family)
MSMARLVVALLLPSVLVAWAMLSRHDVRIAFLLYTLVGCVLSPWLLLGVRPLRTGRGLPFQRRPGSSEVAARGSWPDPRSTVRRGLAQAGVFGVGLFVSYAIGRRWLADSTALQDRLGEMGWNPAHLPVYGVVFVLGIPLLEEWWWRGQALPRCVTRFGPRVGVAIAAASFALYHAFVLAAMYRPASVAVRLLAIAAAGSYWCWLARRRGAWLECYCGHLGASLAVVLAFSLFFLR